VEYGERLKLHVGILLTIGDFHYYVPISSAKPKHQKMSNSLDFHKLQDESTGYLYAVLNINNMIPVPDNCLTQLKYNQVESFRSFSNEKRGTSRKDRSKEDFFKMVEMAQTSIMFASLLQQERGATEAH
jgi:protein AbiQ